MTDWSVSSLHDFDPWAGSRADLPCTVAEHSTGIDVWGPDDTKLLNIPGNGIWAVTYGRPRLKSPDQIACECGQLIFQPYLVQLAKNGEPLNPDRFARVTDYLPPQNYPGWDGVQDSKPCMSSKYPADGASSWDMLWGADPLPLTIEDAETVYGRKQAVEEKNWVLFSYGQQMYVSYQLAPKHRVYSLGPDGRAKLQHETDSEVQVTFFIPSVAPLTA
ncbi:hypothetical protein OEZ86_004330 [Tetradesmus obliquus]|nr:hypothetical protein OEZ86_004330 [Tetradesmus obliquus]